MKKGISIVVVLLVLITLAACAQTPAYTVYVEAGDFDRRHTLISFSMPEEVEGPAFQIRSQEDDVLIPLQVDPERTAWFIIERLDAGAVKTYHLEATLASAVLGVQVEEQDGGVRFSLANQPILQYHAEKTAMPRPDIDLVYHRNGYLHPVHTPSGRVITDDYSPNHLHHHGIWAAWTNTVFQGRTPDFWNMGAGTGTVEGDGVDRIWDGSVHSGLQARHRYVDLTAPEPVTALHEQWDLRIYNTTASERPHYLFDLTLRQTAATESALVLPEYRYGGVGFRGHWDWNGEGNTDFLTSEGKDRSNGHATRARWCHIGGLVDGEAAGIAILGHPDNFEAPQPMRIHPAEPFFNYAPSQAGDWSIEPGTPYTARYRFVVYDGQPDPDDLDRLWNDYAYPPKVRVQGSGF